tara:strand:+ start:336 stop:608 length:273 start_codon:yes stop_codon:yes gene_type:complete
MSERIGLKEAGNDLEMTWEGLKGRMYGKDGKYYVSCELTDKCREDPEPMWFCMTEKTGSPFASFLVGHFEIREYSEAEEWCRRRLMEIYE